MYYHMHCLVSVSENDTSNIYQVIRLYLKTLIYVVMSIGNIYGHEYLPILNR